jgi:hypothetical protein
MGNQTTASGLNSTAMGSSTSAEGSVSTAMGLRSTASGTYSTAMGERTSATGYASTAMGLEAVADGLGSTAMGNRTTASGPSSTAMGRETTAGGDYSVAMGRRAKANHAGTFAWADSQNADFATSGVDQFIVRAAGGVGINQDSPVFPMHIGDGSNRNGYDEEVFIEAQDAVLGLYSPNSGSWGSALVLSETAFLAGNKWAMARTTSGAGAGNENQLRFTFGTDSNYAANDAQMRIEPNGNVRADGAFIGGGADVAESFAIEGDHADHEPGDVLAISTESDGHLVKSTESYSTLIAGVHATKPGVLLTDLGIEADLSGQVPLGVVGVIPTKVCLEGGPIHRGDLLVSSSTPGHAMKADPSRLGFGMIIGKALEPFTGEDAAQTRIKVLVNVK